MDQNIVSIIGIIIILLLFVNVNNIIMVKNSENFESSDNTDKSLIDIYLDYNKKVYEYIIGESIPNRKKNILTNSKQITITEFFKKVSSRYNELFTLSKCGYLYNYYESASSVSGSMYLTDSGVAFTNLDKNDKDGLINTIDNNVTLVISDGDITLQLIKNDIHMDPLTNIITVSLDVNAIKDNFSTNKNYILYPCSTLEHNSNAPQIEKTSDPNSSKGENYIQQTIVDHRVNMTFYIYLGFLVLVIIIYNWKFLCNMILNLFSNKKNNVSETSDTEINNIYYVGGYDYKDYSE